MIPFDLPDANLSYRHYLRTCRCAGVEPVARDRPQGLNARATVASPITPSGGTLWERREDRFRLACNELGWGDPKNGLWFVSIEERSEWDPGDEVKIEHHYSFGRDGPYFRDERDRVPDKVPRDEADFT